MQPPTSSKFSLTMLCRAYETQESLKKEGLLLQEGKILSPYSKNDHLYNLWAHLANPQKISPAQRTKVINLGLLSVLLRKLLGKQSWQHSPMMITPQTLQSLMTKGIPRQPFNALNTIYLTSLNKSEKDAVFESFPGIDQILTRNGTTQQRGNSLIYDGETRFEFSQCGKLVGAIDVIGGSAWVGINDLSSPFLIPVSLPESFSGWEHATKIAFGIYPYMMAIAYRDGHIQFLKISEDLKTITPKSTQTLPYFPTKRSYGSKKDYSVSDIKWAPSSLNPIFVILSVYSQVTFLLMDVNFQIVSKSFINELSSDGSPQDHAISICFSSHDPEIFLTGYNNGKVAFWRITVVGTQIMIRWISTIKIQDSMVPKIKSLSTEQGIFASLGNNFASPEVRVWKISSDFKSIEIMAILPTQTFSFSGPFFMNAFNKIELYLVKNGRLHRVHTHSLQMHSDRIQTCILDMRNSAIILTVAGSVFYIIPLSGLQEVGHYF